MFGLTSSKSFIVTALNNAVERIMTKLVEISDKLSQIKEVEDRMSKEMDDLNAAVSNLGDSISAEFDRVQNAINLAMQSQGVDPKAIEQVAVQLNGLKARVDAAFTNLTDAPAAPAPGTLPPLSAVTTPLNPDPNAPPAPASPDSQTHASQDSAKADTDDAGLKDTSSSGVVGKQEL